MSPNIDTNDLNTKVNQARKFLYQAAIRSKLLFVSEDESWPIQQSGKAILEDFAAEAYQTLR